MKPGAKDIGVDSEHASRFLLHAFLITEFLWAPHFHCHYPNETLGWERCLPSTSSRTCHRACKPDTLITCGNANTSIENIFFMTLAQSHNCCDKTKNVFNAGVCIPTGDL